MRPEERSPLGTPMRRWKVIIKMDLGDVGLEGMDWADVA
jgi:hypothetical protein